jgi:hypothetical protein
MPTCRKTTEADLQRPDGDVFYDHERCVSVVNPAGAIAAIYDLEVRPARQVWLSSAADRDAVAQAVEDHPRSDETGA